MSVNVVIKSEEHLKNLDITRQVKKAVNTGIKEYLNHLKNYALSHKPWQDRSKSLRYGHVIRQAREGGKFIAGWELVADPRINPQGGKDVRYNYAPVLEEHGYAWMKPAFLATKDMIDFYITKELKKIKTLK